MKKGLLILALVIGLIACEEQTRITVVVQHCVTQKWDTIIVKCHAPIHIDASTAVPALKDSWNNVLLLNCCAHKVIKEY